jgi:hypothetical protein
MTCNKPEFQTYRSIINSTGSDADFPKDLSLRLIYLPTRVSMRRAALVSWGGGRGSVVIH